MAESQDPNSRPPRPTRMEPGFKIMGPKFFVQKFSNIGISILEAGNNALLALVLELFAFFLKK